MADPEDKNAVPGITDNPIVKGVNAVAKGAKKVAATPNKVAKGVSSAGRAAFNTFASADRSADKTLRKGAKKVRDILPFADGGAVDGPALLHVGERSPKDKRYETSEFVFAAPGTVVAPIPKGMDITPENAMGLLIAQVLKSMNGSGAPAKKKPVTGSAQGSTTTGGKIGTPISMENLLSMFSQANTLAGNRAQASSQRFNDQVGAANTYAGIDLNRLKAMYSMNHPDMGLPSGASVANHSGDDSMAQSLANAKAMQSLNQGGTDPNELARIALERELGLRSASDREAEAANQNNFWQGQLALQRSQQAFDQLVRGVSDSALPGVRAGRMPTASFT